MDDVEGGVSGWAFAALGVRDGGGENGDCSGVDEEAFVCGVN
jgi:hypothetical protein